MSVFQQLAQLSPEALKLLSKKIGKQKGADVAVLPIRRTERAYAPLSFGQERLWFLDQLVPGSPAYNWPIAIRCTVPLDLSFYTLTLQELLRRHEVLRTSFPVVNGAPVQMIAPVSEPDVRVVDLAALPPQAREEEMQRLVREEARRPFDLHRGPLYRFLVLILGPEEWVSAWTIHHSIIDGWSRKVMLDDLGALGAALASGQPCALPPLALQYGDYAAWQRQWYQGAEGKRLLDYWRGRLDGVVNLDLPTDRVRPAFPRYNGATVAIRLEPALCDQLRDLSKESNTTLFMTLMTAFQVALHRHAGQTDIAVAIPVANRNRSELENLIGFFVNTLVIRCDLSGNPSFRAVLEQVRRHCIDAYAHQEMPFEKLVEELRPAREINRNPLAQVIFQLENIPRSAPSRNQAAAALMAPMEIDAGIAVFDFAVHLYEPWDREMLVREDGITGTLNYNSDIFDAATVQRFVEHFILILESAVQAADTRVGDIAITTALERQQIDDNNDNRAEFPETECIHERVQAQVARTPDAMAVVHEGAGISYAMLNARANRLAHRLRELGVRPETRVMLCVQRSIEMVVAMLAVLKAGGAFVPADPSYPAARIATMLGDSSPLVVLTQGRFAGLFEAATVPVLDLESVSSWAGCSEDDPDPARVGLGPRDLAYLIYTSGSTGAPKAVMIEHRSLQNHLAWYIREFGFTAASKFLVVTSYCFDLTQRNIFAPLFVGGTLHLASEPFNPAEILQTIRKVGIDTLNLTPTAFDALIDANDNGEIHGLQRVILGGEAIRVGRLLALPEPRPAFYNFYGPTECTLIVLFHRLHDDLASYADRSVPLGRPISNARIYVLDAHGRQQPIGIAGEITIGGVPVGRGYFQQEALTQARFVPNPFDGDPRARMYRSGDIGRWRTDGTVEFFGRGDTQVKVRGFRVELSEIETVIERHPAVKAAAVLSTLDEAGDARLTAFVTPQAARLADGNDAEQSQRIADWAQLHDNLFSEIDQDTDATFATVGWNSSYTDQAIPDDEMRESVDGIVGRAMGGAPQRILEIGCGSGMLLFRMAPRVAAYVGTDISQTAIDHVAAEAKAAGLGQVELHCQAADCFDHLAQQSFDLVFLNSVVQYFPHLDYLQSVVEGAIRLLRPGGRMMIGDIRHSELARLFYLSVELSHASATMPLETLERRVARRVTEEEELLVHPDFFRWLQQRVPAISGVDVEIKAGEFHNELTKFRYDVTLHAEATRPSALPIEWMDWQEAKLDLAQLDARLDSAHPETFGLHNIPSARLAADSKALDILVAFHRPKRVLDLREWVETAMVNGVEPEALRALGERHGYRVFINWNAGRPTSRIDVALIADHLPRAEIRWPGQQTLALLSSPYSNNPLYGELCKRLAGELRTDLSTQLPEYMLPAAWVVLEDMPLNTNGKLNRAELASYNDRAMLAAEVYVAPRDHFELAVAQMWEDILGVKPVGAKDNFFALGGHSLLAVRLVARFRREFDRDLPLSVLFEHQSVEQLASVLRSGSSLGDQGALVTLRVGGANTPLFLVHPAGGGVMCYMPLAERLGGDRPVYGLQYAGFALDGGVTDVETMATRYIEAMRARQPSGPYLIGGWSTGGVIAFEMARQLSAIGEAIERLFIIDVPAPVAGEGRGPRSTSTALLSFARKTALYSGRELTVTKEELEGLTHQQQIAHFFERMKQQSLVPPELGLENFSRFLEIYENNIRAVPAYDAGRYAGGAILLRGEDILPEIHADAPAAYADAALHWQTLCDGEVVVHLVPGNHITMITPPHVTTLARVIQRALPRSGPAQVAAEKDAHRG